MRVTVCRLFKSGIPDRSIQEAIPGDLNLGKLHHPVLGRDVTMLHLIDNDRGRQPIEPLMDAFCYCIGADGMFWRGIEAGPMGRQQAQEWFVRPVSA